MLEQSIVNKANWARVAFGDLVRLSKERTKDPEADRYERVVGLEHIDPGDLRIRRWADIAEGTTFTSVFRPGQVLFGKRRAYQRKVAVADFTGVCSGDIYVLEPSSDALMPELLPFICQTDAFFNHAVSTSAGSLSPRTNWKSLADFEFLLPPIQEQARWIEALQSFENTIECLRSLREASTKLLRSGLDDLLRLSHVPGDATLHSEWRSVPLSDVISDARPLSYGILKPGPNEPNGVPMLRVVDFDDLGRRSNTEIMQVSRSVADTSKTTYVQEGDVLLSIVATLGRSFVVPPEMQGWNVNRAIAVLPIGCEVSSEFLEAYFQSGQVRRTLELAKVGSTQPRINLDFLRTLSVPLPPSDIQEKTVKFRQSIANAIISSEDRLSEITKVVQRQLSELEI